MPGARSTFLDRGGWNLVQSTGSSAIGILPSRSCPRTKPMADWRKIRFAILVFARPATTLTAFGFKTVTNGAKHNAPKPQVKTYQLL